MTKVKAFEAAPVASTLKDETLIHIILDETGSMNSCRESTISSFNEYIDSQAQQEGKCLVSLTKFSDIGSYRIFSNTKDNNTRAPSSVRSVFANQDVKDVKHLTESTFTPNGGTNLYDAIGTTVSHMDQTVRDNQNVLVVIITDGGENASREYKLDAIRQLISDRQAKGWTFVYLGANQDAWQVGSTFGLSKGQTMSYSTADMSGTMATLSSATSSYRSMRSTDFADSRAGQVETEFFTSKK